MFESSTDSLKADSDLLKFNGDEAGSSNDASESDTVAADSNIAAVESNVDAAESSSAVAESNIEPLVITHLFPTLLNLYGDNGNVRVLEQRIRWRGIPVQVERIEDPNDVDLSHSDIVFIGGGPDREQHQASAGLSELREQLVTYVEDGGALLAICGGYQIIGKEWLMGDEEVPGLSLVDITTKRAEGGSHNRLVGNIVLNSPLAATPVVGFENHAGRTYLGADVESFGRIVGSQGSGNNDDDHADGVIYKNLIGSYLHGPLLAKNPEVADALIAKALKRRIRKADTSVRPMAATSEAITQESIAVLPEQALLPLEQLDDTVELRANENMRKKLGVK